MPVVRWHSTRASISLADDRAVPRGSRRGGGRAALESAKRIPPSNNHALGETTNAIAVTQPDTIAIRSTEARRAKTPDNKAIKVQKCRERDENCPYRENAQNSEDVSKDGCNHVVCPESGVSEARYGK
jgi:hypothetical protein